MVYALIRGELRKERPSLGREETSQPRHYKRAECSEFVCSGNAAQSGLDALVGQVSPGQGDLRLALES